MNTPLIVIITVILIVSILITLYIIKLNKIKYYKIRVDEAGNLIIEELNNRFELIISTENKIRKNIKKDLNFYHELEKVKKSHISSYDLDLEINKAIDTLYTIENDYPKISENKDLKKTFRVLRESDTKIIAAKSFYNKNAIELNSLIKKMPYNLLAKINNIDIATLYEALEIFDE